MRRVSGTRLRRGLMQAFGDFGLAMGCFWGCFWLISLGTTAHHGRTLVLLSLTVATMAALDLAILRHLRRVYASPRRGVWRRD